MEAFDSWDVYDLLDVTDWWGTGGGSHSSDCRLREIGHAARDVSVPAHPIIEANTGE